MKSKINKIIKKPFVRNVLIMATGTASAQVINLILSPIITRLYGPEAYGVMGTFLAIVSIITPIAALTYPIAIVLPKSDDDAKGLVRLSIYVSISISLLISVILLLFDESIANLFNLNSVTSYLYLIPVVVLFTSFLQVTEKWLTRTKQFAIIAKAKLLQALITEGSKVAIGFFYPLSIVLVVLSALKSGLKALMMQLFLRRTKNKQNNRLAYNRKSSIKKLAKKYYDFPLYRSSQEFLNASSQNLPILLLTTLFGPASAGFYSIARTVLGIPVQLIGKSIGDVFYPKISEAANRKENLTILIKKATIALIGVGILPFGIIICFGPLLFSLVFGEEWVTAGEYARWIALWTFTGFVNRPSFMSLPVLSEQRFHFIYTIFMLITRIVALSIGFYLFSDDLMAIILFSVAGALLNVGLTIITISKSKKNYRED